MGCDRPSGGRGGSGIIDSSIIEITPHQPLLLWAALRVGRRRKEILVIILLRLIVSRSLLIQFPVTAWNTTAISCIHRPLPASHHPLHMGKTSHIRCPFLFITYPHPPPSPPPTSSVPRSHCSHTQRLSPSRSRFSFMATDTRAETRKRLREAENSFVLQEIQTQTTKLYVFMLPAALFSSSTTC